VRSIETLLAPLSFLILGLALTAGAMSAQQFDSSLYKGMKWRLIGPFRGGRVLAVAGIANQPETYYFGGVSGGVWKTTDSGQTWIPLSDKESFSSVGSIAVAESDPNVIYVGSGEACIRGNITHGDGVWKSTDGGKTWKNMGLKDTQSIGRVIVDPRNPNNVLVAALGHAYGSNAERGLFRSTDGGQNWEKVLYKDDKTGAIDVAFDPHNSSIVFAALWEVIRKPWTLSSGGPGSGLYKSNDGGKTWKHLEGNGLPSGILGRIGVSVSGADGNRVYALIEATEGGLYRSDDGGEHWSYANKEDRFRQRAWYFTHVFADPKDADLVYILNTGMFSSRDGGKSFSLVAAPHGDHHGLWINPNHANRMINSNDGGADITMDGGKTWSTQYNQPTAQFYHVAADTHFPYRLYGAQQDNSSVAIATASDDGFIDRPDWYAVGGGEAGWIAPYPPDSNIVFAGDNEGLLTRYNRTNGQVQVINPWPDTPSGWGVESMKYRTQWTAPFFVSPHDANVIYLGTNVLLKSTNAGMSWQAVSPDLTRNDKSKQGPSGGPITKDNTSAEYYDTIFALDESPLEKGVIWAGSDDGLVHITRDAGQTWTNITPKDLPEWSRISLLAASPHDRGTAYLTVDRHELDDLHPYVYKTSDYGKSWTKITGDLPDNFVVRAVREDPARRGLLFAGTESGVMVSFDDGKHWQSLQLNLPVSPVRDVIVKNEDLAIATHGRSFWVLDDLAPLRQLSAEAAGSSAYLFKPRVALRSQIPSGLPSKRPVGQNPPGPALIDYYLKAAPKEVSPGKKEEVQIEILDSQGKLVRKFSNNKPPEEQPESEFEPEQHNEGLLAPEAGMNRFAWDLKYEPPTKAKDEGPWTGRPEGPLVVPGTYQVRLTAEGKTLTAPLEVKLEPRVKTSQADLEKQLELALRIRDAVNEDHKAVTEIREVRSQMQDLKKRLAGRPQAKVITEAADAIDKKMTPVEEKLIQPKLKSSEDSLNYPIMLSEKMLALGGLIENSDTLPTEQSYEVFKTYRSQLDEELAKWNEIRGKDVAAFNELVQKESIPPLLLPSTKTE
jgi:photosystem II stability/assembly factor-like uncharacterized protein